MTHAPGIRRTTARRFFGSFGRPPARWEAVCLCGWYGPKRSTPRGADADATAHRVAEAAAA